MSEFINKLKITLNNLVRIGDVGYTEAMSEMIITELQKYKITERPIHCIIKTENEKITHIRENDIWNKDRFDLSDEIIPIANKIDRKTKDEYNVELEKYKEKRGDEIFKIKIKNIGNNLRNNNTKDKLNFMEKVFNNVELKNNEIQKYMEKK